jgi:hypothetical protein
MSKNTEGTRFEQNQGLEYGFSSARVFARHSLARLQAEDHQREAARRQYFV